MSVLDRATRRVLGCCLLALLAGTLLRLHGSSIAMWNSPAAPRVGLLLGVARDIRVDEWGIVTPAMLSQARHDPQ